MKKILIIKTKYKIFGGEDSNILQEVDLLKKHFDVEYIQYDNSTRLTFSDLFTFFTLRNATSNLKLKTLQNFEPEIVYIHNTWFKANCIF